MTLPKRKPHPPQTLRYCTSCGQKTKWKYDPGVFHSRCMVCGGSYSLKDVPQVTE